MSTRILIFQQPTSRSPIIRWLRELDSSVEVAVVTGTDWRGSAPSVEGAAASLVLDNYFSTDHMPEIVRFALEFGPDRVLSNAEDDLIRAAALRSLLGTAGLSEELALVFRDKVAMKGLFLDAGLAAPRWENVAGWRDVGHAIEAFGRVVLKPRRAAGSRGVHVLGSIADMNRLAATDVEVWRNLASHDLIVEEFVSGDQFHIDALVLEDEIRLFSPSRYSSPPADFRERNIVSAMVDGEDPRYQQMYTATQMVISTLPVGHGVSILHLEVFITPDGQLFAGEIAARLGGGMIRDAVMRAFSVNLSKEAYLAASGLLRSPTTHLRERLVGWVLWVASEPRSEHAEIPWVSEFWRSERADHDPSDSADSWAGALIAGESMVEIERRAQSLF